MLYSSFFPSRKPSSELIHSWSLTSLRRINIVKSFKSVINFTQSHQSVCSGLSFDPSGENERLYIITGRSFLRLNRTSNVTQPITIPLCRNSPCPPKLNLADPHPACLLDPNSWEHMPRRLPSSPAMPRVRISLRSMLRPKRLRFSRGWLATRLSKITWMAAARGEIAAVRIRRLGIAVLGVRRAGADWPGAVSRNWGWRGVRVVFSVSIFYLLLFFAFVSSAFPFWGLRAWGSLRRQLAD